MIEVGLGLGSNIGEKAAHVRRAARELEASGAVRNLVLSSLYRTAPWGYVDQDWFVNACAVASTALSPAELLQACLACESRMGRERVLRWGPRIIDIDVLYAGDLALDTPALRLPHPGILQRAFVLVPLAELRPNLVIGGVALADALARLDTSDVVPLDAA